MTKEYLVVDAFTSERYSGNPAAVVLDARGLDGGQMQRIAAEFNLSETTFVLPASTPEASIRFRWFTPAVEVALCGHATIGGLRALVDTGRVKHDGLVEGTPILIETKSGILAASIETIPGVEKGLMFWLELPPPKLIEMSVGPGELAAMLRVDAVAFEPAIAPVRTQDGDLILFVRDVVTLNAAAPDFEGLRSWQDRHDVRGLCLATARTLTPAVHVQSRFFAPVSGINEDPVTGSVHGPLAALLVKCGLVPVDEGTAGLTCVQGRAGGRAGVVHALVRCGPGDTFSVKIAGQAVTTMRGTLL